MNKEACFNLGYIIRTVGLKGALEFLLDVDVPDNYKKLKSVFIETNGQLLPFTVKQVQQLKKNKAVVLLEGIDSIEKAEKFVKSGLFLPLSSLPPLKGKDFYFHEIIGFKAIDKTHGDIGIVESILELPQQNIIQLKKNYKEILIPVKADFIVKIDRENKTLELDAPEGLIDVYLNDSDTSNSEKY